MTKRKLHININLDKDFVTTLKHLNRKYGDQMCYLNGLADKQINYTEFIDQFVKSTSVADASIDSNANIDHKDITTLENEMSKPHSSPRTIKSLSRVRKSGTMSSHMRKVRCRFRRFV